MNLFSKNLKKKWALKVFNVLVVLSLVSGYSFSFVSVVRADELPATSSDVVISESSSSDSSQEGSVSDEKTSEEKAQSVPTPSGDDNECEENKSPSSGDNNCGGNDNCNQEEKDSENSGNGCNNCESKNSKDCCNGENKNTKDCCDGENKNSKDCGGDDEDNTIVGSIRVCKVIVDAEGNLVTSPVSSGSTFEVAGNSASTLQFGLPNGTIPTSTFTTPLTLNSNLFGGDEVNDAQCVTYSNLEVKDPGYYYAQESISGIGWQSPVYNDQFGMNGFGQGSSFDITKFYGFSGQLFDTDISNDGARNQSADGHVTLTSTNKNRTLVVVNKETEVVIDSCVEPVYTTHILYSSADATIDGTSTAATETWVHPNWGVITGAKWIWDSVLVANPSIAESKTFNQYFLTPSDVNDGEVTSATLTLLADNSYDVSLNGNASISVNTGEHNYETSTVIDLNPDYFNNGGNNLKVTVTNIPVADSDAYSNPAGVAYKLDYTVKSCNQGDIHYYPSCGNGIVEEGEECDAGPNGNSACSTMCQTITTTDGGGDTNPLLAVIKVITGTTTAEISDFPLSVGTTSVTSGVATTFIPGTYTVTEANPSSFVGFTTTFSGDCDSSGSVTLAVNESKTCTITNAFTSDTNDGGGDTNGGGNNGGSNGGSSRGGSRVGGSVAGANTAAPLGEVLGASLAQTGQDSTISMIVTLSALLALIAFRRKETIKI